MMIVCVEGNIGCGKSTFLKEVMKHIDNVEIIEEPVSAKYLKELYNTEKGTYNNSYTLPFQLIMATMRKLKQNEAIKKHEADPEKIIFMERSLKTDWEVFAKIAVTDEEDYNLYCDFRREVLMDIHREPDLILYLQSAPDGCFKRINERMKKQKERKCETTIDKDTLAMIHLAHETWILGKDNFTPTMIINTEDNDWRNEDVMASIAKEIKTDLSLLKEGLCRVF